MTVNVVKILALRPPGHVLTEQEITLTADYDVDTVCEKGKAVVETPAESDVFADASEGKGRGGLR